MLIVTLGGLVSLKNYYLGVSWAKNIMPFIPDPTSTVLFFIL